MVAGLSPRGLKAAPYTAAPMKRIVILISGRGSNMQAIVERCASQAWPAQVVAVVANRADAAGLTYAAERGIATAVVAHRGWPVRAEFDAELARVIDGFAPDWLVLAGFMRILGPAFVQHYAGRLLNIHPSLLPAFPGLHTHARALAAGCQAVGATVHFVTAALDHGPIVVQSVVPVLPGDDPNTLSERVLATEHVIYPLALRWAVTDRLALADGRVRQLDGEPQLLIQA